MNNATDSLSIRLKELRGTVNQLEVAEAIGISRAALGYYESGKRKPDADIIRKLCEYYHVSSDYLLGLSDIKKADSTIQGIASMTGLSENVINKLCYYNERITSYTESLNIILRSPNFESALHHIPKYIQAVKIFNLLQNQRRERYENVLSSEPDGMIDGKAIYNWPYNDDLDKNYKECEKEMILQEYSIDKAFKYIIQELERIAKEK